MQQQQKNDNKGVKWKEVKKYISFYRATMHRQLDVISELEKSFALNEKYVQNNSAASNDKIKHKHKHKAVYDDDGDGDGEDLKLQSETIYNERMRDQFKFKFITPSLNSSIYQRPPDSGFSKFQVWQRNQLLKEPSMIMINASFGNRTNPEEEPLNKSKNKTNAPMPPSTKGKSNNSNVMSFQYPYRYNIKTFTFLFI